MSVLIRGAVLVGLLFPCQAYAEGPPGTYNLTAIGSFTHGTVEGNRVPTCGLVAQKALGSQKQLLIRYSKLVMVGATPWTFLGAYSSMTGARNPESDATTQIEVWFWQKGDVATAMLTYSQIDDRGKTTCITARNYSGTYQP